MNLWSLSGAGDFFNRESFGIPIRSECLKYTTPPAGGYQAQYPNQTVGFSNPACGDGRIWRESVCMPVSGGGAPSCPTNMMRTMCNRETGNVCQESTACVAYGSTGGTQGNYGNYAGNSGSEYCNDGPSGSGAPLCEANCFDQANKSAAFASGSCTGYRAAKLSMSSGSNGSANMSGSSCPMMTTCPAGQYHPSVSGSMCPSSECVSSSPMTNGGSYQQMAGTPLPSDGPRGCRMANGSVAYYPPEVSGGQTHTQMDQGCQGQPMTATAATPRQSLFGSVIETLRSTFSRP